MEDMIEMLKIIAQELQKFELEQIDNDTTEQQKIDYHTAVSILNVPKDFIEMKYK